MMPPWVANCHDCSGLDDRMAERRSVSRVFAAFGLQERALRCAPSQSHNPCTRCFTARWSLITASNRPKDPTPHEYYTSMAMVTAGNRYLSFLWQRWRSALRGAHAHIMFVRVFYFPPCPVLTPHPPPPPQASALAQSPRNSAAPPTSAPLGEFIGSCVSCIGIY
jgi:hypothetical protein